MYKRQPQDGEVLILQVESTRYALAFLAAAWFGHPASKLKTIGITGTKGKTTSTYLVKSILENAGLKVGLVGTIEVIIGDTHIHAENTTPESYVLQSYFARMVEEGCDAVVMEVSSQALMQHRSQGLSLIHILADSLSREGSYVWGNIFTPCELVHCFGLRTLSIEVLSCYMSGFHLEDYFIDYAQDIGLAPTLCSYHKTFVGGVESGVIQKPDYAITTSLSCDGNLNTFRELEKKAGFPFTFLDVPYRCV